MTQATGGSTHRATQENGPSVVAGRLIWTSASGITTADPNSYGGCLRRWWYEKVGGVETTETEAMRGGTALHKEIESHLLTGTSLASPRVLAGRMFIPQPGGSLAIERPIHFKTKDGVSIFGHVDLYNFRQEYIDEEGEVQPDPPWSFEVKDWKTTSDFGFAKNARELAENVQLATYAEAGFRFAPDMEHVRLTHVYFKTKGRPEAKLVTIRRSREEIAQRWEYNEAVVRSMGHAASETTAETVPGQRKACDAYGGCPHRGGCSVYQSNSLDALFSKIAADHTETKDNTVGLLSSGTILPPPAPDMRASLAAEEATMRTQVAQQQQQMPQNVAQLADVCARLSAYGYGFPALGGNAAQAYASLGGQSVPPGFVYQGIPAAAGAKRSLHSIQLTEPGHIFQIEGELAAERGQPIPTAPAQQAPVTNVATNQAPISSNSTLYTQRLEQAYSSSNNIGGILPPGAPESIPALAQARPAAPTEYTLGSEPAATPPKKGRPKKEKVLDAAPEATAAVETPTTPPPASVGVPASPVPPVATSSLYSRVASVALDSPAFRDTVPVKADPPCVVLINARAVSLSTRSLAPYVDYINGELAKRYCVTSDGKPGVQDVRCAPKDSPLAFGGWKGAVREVVKADPPPPGDYHLDTFVDELNEVVADALRVVTENKGWLYIRGTR